MGRSFEILPSSLCSNWTPNFGGCWSLRDVARAIGLIISTELLASQHAHNSKVPFQQAKLQGLVLDDILQDNHDIRCSITTYGKNDRTYAPFHNLTCQA